MFGVPFPDTPNTPIGFQSHGVPPGFAACCVAYPGVNIRKDVENTWGNPGKNDQRWIFHIEL